MKLLLFLHIAGCVLFLGNIITAAFWKVRADIKKDPHQIHQACKNVMLADYVFTLPGLLLILVSGISMALDAGYDRRGFSWLTASLALFVMTGILWLGVLIPLQRGLIKLSFEAVSKGSMPAEYKKLSLYWAVFGTLATVLPVIILYFMVGKPF